MIMGRHNGSLTSRLDLSPTEYNDISVECGTSTISLAILLCPVVFTGYNESLLILNKLSDDPQCKGTMDESVTPPVIRFEFPLNATNSCGSVFKVSRWKDPAWFVNLLRNRQMGRLLF